MSNVLSAKLADEKVVVTLDFSDSLASGETLTGTPIVTVTINSGVDANPEAILNGLPQISADSRAVLVPTDSGIPNCSYRIAAECDTTNPAKRLECIAVLPIR